MWNGRWAAKRAAPRPPKAPPSVERKTIVCGGPHAARPPACSPGRSRARARRALPCRSRRRSPLGRRRVSSRCAITTIASGDCPAATAQRFCSRTRPTPGTRLVPGVARDREPVGRSCLAKPPRRTRASRRCRARGPGTASRIRPRASRVAVPSKFGGSRGAGSGAGRVTLKARIRSGSATTTKAPR